MRTSLISLVAAGALVGLSGCNRDRTAETVAAMNTSNVQRLANMYAAHQNMKGGRGPNSEAEFKEFVRTYDANKLKMMGINPDELDGLFADVDVAHLDLGKVDDVDVLDRLDDVHLA